MTEPAPRRHRRRERRRSRTAGTEASPGGAGETAGEYAAPAGKPPVEGGKDRARRRFGRGGSPDTGGDRTDAADAVGIAGVDTGPGGAGWPRRRSSRVPARRAPATDTGGASVGEGGPGDAGGRPGRDAGGRPGTGRGAVGSPPETDAGEPGQATAGRPRPARRPDLERGLRGIVGSGPSQVGVLGAMRARDAARPTVEDLAAAERDLVVVRRHYVPPEADPPPT